MLPNMSDEQAVQMIDTQLAALKLRYEAGERIVQFCREGSGILANAPEATMINIGQVVSALIHGLQCLIQANLEANSASLREIHQQMAQLESARHQRASKVHLGGFVPSAAANFKR